MLTKASRPMMGALLLVLIAALALGAYPGPGNKPASASVNQLDGASSIAAPASGILIGEYSGHKLPSDIDAYTSAVGSRPDLVQWFQSWEEPLYYSSQRAGIDARNVTPMITWSPGANFTTADMLSGKYDAYLIAQARSAKAWTRPLMIRPFHEMNGTWNSYGYGQGSAAQFVSAWRHLVGLFRAQGVTNVTWVWSPNIYGFGNTAGFDSLYPGDAYVDWVGLDGYNFAGTWRTFSALFTNSYRDITRLTAKPLMIAEWGCNESEGSKATWIRDAFRQFPTAMPRVRAIVAFSHVAEADFRVNSTATSLAAYRTALATLAAKRR